MQVFDHDLWESSGAGLEDQFDADRFGLWLEVLSEAGVDIAARKLVDMDFDFVTAAISRHVLVLPGIVYLPGTGAESLFSDRIPGQSRDVIQRLARMADEFDSGRTCDIAGYTVVGRRGESWDAVLSVLARLDADHPEYLQRLLNRCCRVAVEYIDDNDSPHGFREGLLYNVQTTDQQIMSDVALERERRREGRGYVTPSQAVAFLESSRHLTL